MQHSQALPGLLAQGGGLRLGRARVEGGEDVFLTKDLKKVYGLAEKSVLKSDMIPLTFREVKYSLPLEFHPQTYVF